MASSTRSRTTSARSASTCSFSAEDFQEPQTQRERRALERIQRLQNECQRLVDISNDFLRFARVKDLELQPADLAEVVEELVDFFGPMARAASIEIKSYIPADLPPVALDRDLFKQALLNLLLNAQQAMPGGGEMTIQAAAGRRTASVLELIDTGQGHVAEVLAKAFQPFYSTRSGGTGLGLPTTRKIIEAHGGTHRRAERGRPRHQVHPPPAGDQDIRARGVSEEGTSLAYAAGSDASSPSRKLLLREIASLAISSRLNLNPKVGPESDSRVGGGAISCEPSATPWSSAADSSAA